MSDYTKTIPDLSSDTQESIFKTLRTYTKAYNRKQDIKHFHGVLDRHFHDGKPLSRFSHEEFTEAFKAKNFWRDLEDCGSWLEFRHYVDHDKTKLHHGNFCKRDKLCPACAVRRAYKQQQKFMSIVEETPDLLNRDWYYIVLPVKHTKADRFEDVFALVEDISRKISMQMRDGRRGKSSGFFSNFTGGMSSVEVTETKNGWNVHLNLLLSASNGGLRAAGGGAHCGHEVPVRSRSLWVSKLKEHKQIWNGKEKVTFSSPDLSEWLEQFNGSYINSVTPLDFSSKDQVRSALVEILKYALKFSSLSNLGLMEVFIKTKGKRLFRTFGDLWGKGLDNVSLDGDTELTGDFIELIYVRAFDKDFPQMPTYDLYRRSIKQEEKKEHHELVHTFGIVVPKIAEYRKYYRSAPLIIVPTGGGVAKFNIRKKE